VNEAILNEAILILVLSLVLLFAVRFFWKLATGQFNSIVVLEWASRGFAFGLGLMTAFIVVILLLKMAGAIK